MTTHKQIDDAFILYFPIVMGSLIGAVVYFGVGAMIAGDWAVQYKIKNQESPGVFEHGAIVAFWPVCILAAAGRMAMAKVDAFIEWFE